MTIDDIEPPDFTLVTAAEINEPRILQPEGR